LSDATVLLRNLALAVALLPMAIAAGSGLAAPPAALASTALGEPGTDDVDAPEPWDARVAGTGSLGLRLRNGPGMSYPVTGTLPEGSRVAVTEGPSADGEGREWYRVVARASLSGWAAGSYLRAIDANEPDPPQVATARAATAPLGRTLVVQVSAYAHGTRTASGTPVRWGVVAVDPRVIPLGSRLMIEGFEDVFVAEDTGGAIRGNHIDLYFPDVASALRFGVQTRTVTILS
jgi:3D (Asp-Asp-Asp) domain-containing protein